MNNSESKYDKNTYIGYLKLFNGGMKVIPGEIDNKIISNRDKILEHLNLVLSGGKSLKDKNYEKYFSALGGKFLRLKMNLPESGNISGGTSKVIKDTHKLLKLAAKHNKIDTALDIFKGSAPQLYEKLETKISGGQVRDTGSVYSNSSRRSSYRSDNFIGGDFVKDFSSKHTYADDPNFNLRFYLLDKYNFKDRNNLIKEYKNSHGVPDFRHAQFYLAAIDSGIQRNKICDDDDQGIEKASCKDKITELTSLGKKLFGEVKKVYSKIRGDDIYEVLDDAPILQGFFPDPRKKKGGYDDRRDSYRSNSSRRSSYRSDGGYNDDRRESYRSNRSEYNDNRHRSYRSDNSRSYSINGGDIIETIKEKTKSSRELGSPTYSASAYARYFQNNIDDAKKVLNRYYGKLPADRYKMKSLDTTALYLGALNVEYVQGIKHDTSRPNEDYKLRKSRIYNEFEKIVNQWIADHKGLLMTDYINQIHSFESDAPGISTYPYELDDPRTFKSGIEIPIPDPNDRTGKRKTTTYVPSTTMDSQYLARKMGKGGYDRDDYNRGGMHREEDNYNRGGYDRDDYNRGGMRREEDDYEGGYRNRYYSDNMHGGALGEFRKDIGRNLFNNNINKLRENILNIELD
jgi:hypothetical protein